MQERQRLARDLHDSVKQTLFMIGSTADALLLQNDISDSKITGQLDQLRHLSQIALAEMNVMLVELHPRRLIEVHLDTLLQRLTESLAGHTRATLEVIATPLTYPLPLDVKVVFYRVAQEALTNVIKHADAAHVVVTLVEHDSRVELAIKDDGIGFDLGAIPGTGLGLENMRERAAAQSLNFSIMSEPDQGTRVGLRWRYDDVQRENTHRSG